MTWLERQVRNTSLRQIGMCGLLLAAVACLLVANYRYLNNVFHGAYDMPRSELLGVRSPEKLPRYWINIEPDRVVDTGVDIVTVSTRRGSETGRSVTGRYYVALLDDHLLLVKAPPDWKPDDRALIGSLTGPNTSMVERLASNAQMPDIKQSFLPVMLDADIFVSEAMILLLLAAAGVALALVFGAVALRRARNPSAHFDLRALASDALAAISTAIETDIAQGRVAKLKNHVRITASHLVQSGGLKFRLRPLSDLLNAYSAVTTTRLYGIIPTRRDHSVTFYFSDRQTKVKASKAQAGAVMQHLADVAPWVLLGHAPEIDAAYKKDRNKLVAFVAMRRAEVMQLAVPRTSVS